MSCVEQVTLLVLLAAARDAVIASNLLRQPAPDGYFYVWGYAVCGTSPSWLPGLWESAKGNP